jgi:hypothetical protein
MLMEGQMKTQLAKCKALSAKAEAAWEKKPWTWEEIAAVAGKPSLARKFFHDYDIAGLLAMKIAIVLTGSSDVHLCTSLLEVWQNCTSMGCPARYHNCEARQVNFSRLIESYTIAYVAMYGSAGIAAQAKKRR